MDKLDSRVSEPARGGSAGAEAARWREDYTVLVCGRVPRDCTAVCACGGEWAGVARAARGAREAEPLLHGSRFVRCMIDCALCGGAVHPRIQ